MSIVFKVLLVMYSVYLPSTYGVEDINDQKNLKNEDSKTVEFKKTFDSLILKYEENKNEINKMLTGQKPDFSLEKKGDSADIEEYKECILRMLEEDGMATGFIVSTMKESSNDAFKKFGNEAEKAVNDLFKNIQNDVIKELTKEESSICQEFKDWLMFLNGYESLEINDFGNTTIEGIYNTSNTSNFESSHNWVQKTFPNICQSGATFDKYFLNNANMGENAKEVYKKIYSTKEYNLTRKISLYHKGRLLSAYFKHDLEGGVNILSDGNICATINKPLEGDHNQLRLTRVLVDLYTSCPWALKMFKDYMEKNNTINLTYYNEKIASW